MATTSELLLDELIMAAEDLFEYGKHDGNCTNEAQTKLLPKIDPCKKHTSALKAREDRFRRAIEQVKLLRDVFGSSPE